MALLVLSSFYPETRVWGFNWLAYIPGVFFYTVLTFMLGAGIFSIWAVRRSTASTTDTTETGWTNRVYYSAVLLLSIIMITCFVLFRGKTHFLGDGYQLLSLLAGGGESAKTWDLGISAILRTVFSILAGDPESKALLSYQIVSIGSGALLLIFLGIAAKMLFSNRWRSFLFFAGIATSGFALLFFGYVENYALMIVATTAFAIVGISAASNRASAWWPLIPFAIACFTHLFAIVLLPALLYVLLRKSRLGIWIAGLQIKTKRLVTAALFVAAMLTYYYLQTNRLFFMFAFLPIFPDRFTVDHDTLLSFKHIADIFNLLILLLPGFFVLATAVLSTGALRGKFKAEYNFLIILLLSGLAAVSVFNPGIGMPRNWDLFSILGGPLSVLFFYTVLDRVKAPMSSHAALLAIALGLALLVPRVISQKTPEIAIAHFRNYMELDRVRNRNARKLLIDHYRAAGDSISADEETKRWKQDFPEITLNNTVRRLIDQGKYREAIMISRRCLEYNPLYFDAYFNIGGCYYSLSMTDSALFYLELSDGINPYNTNTLSMIGAVYLEVGQYEKAEQYFMNSMEIDSTTENALSGLVYVYLQQNRFEQIPLYLNKLHELSSTPAHLFQAIGDLLLQQRSFELATSAYDFAVDRGLDPAYIDSLKESYPQLQK